MKLPILKLITKKSGVHYIPQDHMCDVITKHQVTRFHLTSNNILMLVF